MSGPRSPRFISNISFSVCLFTSNACWCVPVLCCIVFDYNNSNDISRIGVGYKSIMTFLNRHFACIFTNLFNSMHSCSVHRTMLGNFSTSFFISHLKWVRFVWWGVDISRKRMLGAKCSAHKQVHATRITKHSQTFFISKVVHWICASNWLNGKKNFNENLRCVFKQCSLDLIAQHSFALHSLCNIKKLHYFVTLNTPNHMRWRNTSQIKSYVYEVE